MVVSRYFRLPDPQKTSLVLWEHGDIRNSFNQLTQNKTLHVFNHSLDVFCVLFSAHHTCFWTKVFDVPVEDLKQPLTWPWHNSIPTWNCMFCSQSSNRPTKYWSSGLTLEGPMPYLQNLCTTHFWKVVSFIFCAVVVSHLPAMNNRRQWLALGLTLILNIFC